MYSKEFFDKVKQLTDKLNGYKQTSTLAFKSMDEKLMLKEVYLTIYPKVQMDIACPACIMHYLNMLQSWYEREHPLYLATVEPTIEPDAPKKVIKHYVGIKQKKKQ